MKRHYFLPFLGLFAFAVIIHSCKKDAVALTTPPFQAHFVEATGSYIVKDNPASEFKIPVGLTTRRTSAVTVNVTLTSPTNAASGVQYTLPSSSVTIPADSTIQYITVKGIYAGYPLGANRRDTLLFTITGEAPGDFNQTYTLIMQGSCDVNLNNLLGAYANTNELFGTSAYGPYTTTITAVQSLSPTSGTITVSNIWDVVPSWAPITFTLDWSSGNKITLIEQSGIGDAGTINSNYAGSDISVRPFAGANGTFDYCNSKLTLKMQLGVTGLGWFPDLYTVTMQR